ncbi:MAG: LiaF-related protein [Eubacteriales bacterium]|nr:LiaF-related protein [Eubacteriales bacterium]
MKQNNFSANKLFFGICFLLGAVALILNRLGYFTINKHLNLFTIILTIFFIWTLIQGVYHINFTAILFSLAFLAIIYDEPLGITVLTPGTVLAAAILGSIGLGLLFPKHLSPRHRTQEFSQQHISKSAKIFDAPDQEEIHLSNTFGASIKYINTDTFICGNFDNSFGELKIYFDNTLLKNGEAEININNTFGSTILYIPRTWRVENYVRCFFGDFKEELKPVPADGPVLKIYGEVVFGEAKVIFI